MVGLRQAVLAELPDHVDRDMVAAGDMAVEEQAVQHRLAGQFDPPLLHQFAAQRIEEGLADLDAAARQMPAGDVAVLDQKHPVVAIQHHGADPERHAAGEPPIEMENPPQRRLEALLRRFCSVIAAELSDDRAITFDPCAIGRLANTLRRLLRISRDDRAAAVAQATEADLAMTAFTLAHLSDPHLPPMPAARLRDLAGKRALGYLNWTRNRHKYHRRDVLDALVADMQAQRAGPHRGHRRSRQSGAGGGVHAGAGLAGKRRRAGSRHRHPRQSRRLCSRHAASLCRQLRDDYLRGDDGGRWRRTFPFLRRRGPLALIGVSSAVPTPPLMATGWLGRSQLDALERMLAELSAEQAFRVLLVHHPLRSDSRIKRLTDSHRPAARC